MQRRKSRGDTCLLAIGGSLLFLVVLAPSVVMAASGITNPLNKTLPQIVADLMTGLRDIAVPIAVILILYGGFQIMTAGGNPQKFEEGKKTLLYTAIGLAVILLAQTIADVIKDIIAGT
jgi:type IV secretory pathway VirB2 component (pilin)